MLISASCTLQFTYTATYPDEAPLVEVTESENLDDDHINELLNLIHSVVRLIEFFMSFFFAIKG